MDPIKQVEQEWRRRVIAQGYKRGSTVRAKAQVEFFLGAIAALDTIPPQWGVPLMRGDDILQYLQEQENRAKVHDLLSSQT